VLHRIALAVVSEWYQSGVKSPWIRCRQFFRRPDLTALLMRIDPVVRSRSAKTIPLRPLI
jgi:hypothetical protein